MKKRLFALLLTLCMLATMIVVPAYATEEEQTSTTQLGYCQHCETVIPEEQWLPWDTANTGPRTGHYYLAEDLDTQAKQITINLDDDLCRNVICLDLRGRSYTTKGIRPFLIYGVFSIMDSVGGGEMTTTGYTANANGAFCQMSKKSGCVDGAGELNVYSGTIRRVNTATSVVAYGGLIYASSGATVNLYGGKLVGGDVHARFNSSGNPVAPLGGTIYANAAYVNVCGGTITGGTANDTTLTLSDGTTEDYNAGGGNIYAEKKSVVTISGGSVENGYSDTYGGNMYIKNSTLKITGGTVTGGYSEGYAGNIHMTGSGCSFEMSGGVVKNGVSITSGGNLYVNNSGVDVEITGGEIYGDVTVGLFNTFKLAGAPKLYMGLGNGLRLKSANEAKADVSGLTAGAVIYLDGVDQVFTEVLETPETYLAYFKDAVRADITVDATGALAVAQGSTGFCPHCWKSGEQAAWTAWHNNGSTSTSVINEIEDKHYYLTADTTRSGVVAIGSTAVTGNDVVFDMAGNTWTTIDKKLMNIYSTISLMDSVGGGVFTSTGQAKANGGVIQCYATGVFNMYSGTLSRTVASGEERKGVLVGGILYAPKGSSTNVYGGTIRDGISASISSNKRYCRGGNICAEGSFTMTGGAIVGGQAYANSYILQNPEDPVKNSSGDAITQVSYGGNLYLSGDSVISGGHIVGGNATIGGNIYTAGTATLSVSNCVVRGGVADATAGLVDETLSHSVIAGNLFITGSSSNRQELTITDTIFRSGTSTEYAGNLYATYTNLTLRNCIIADGVAGETSGSTGNGGNLYLTGSVTCDMYDTVIGNGYAQKRGGNLYALSGIAFNMHSGLIVGGEAKDSGGNVYTGGFRMESGVVTGGVAGLYGGNIYIYDGENNYLSMEAKSDAPAPVVSGGESSSLGGNIYLGKNTAATITGAIIENGNGDTGSKYATYDADNIFAYTGTTVTLTDTVIRGIASDDNYGNGVYASGELILKGATYITNEEKDSCIYMASAGKLTVDAGFTGESSVAFQDDHIENPDEPQGGNLAEQNTASGVFTGTLLLEGWDGRDYGLPAIFAEEGDSKLYIAATAVVDPALNTVVWYRDNDAAAAAVTDSSYLKLHKAENTLNLNCDLVVDLNGNNLSVTGTGTISGFDSKNDDYSAFGTLTADGEITVQKAFMAPNGRQYVAVTDETGTSFHRLGLAVTGVSLRPTAQGIYFKAAWECDDTLRDKIDSFGVAVSTVDVPKADFATDADTLYTTVAAENLVSGQAVTSAMIENIVKPGEDNQTRGAMPIYAAPYAVIDGVTVVADDNAPTMGGVIYSMKTVLQGINRIWPKLSDTQQQAVRDLYAIDGEVFDTWDLYNITAAINGTASIRPLKILALGHSLSVDSGHMLNMIAATEGYSEEFIVGTLYYSGCKLSQHVKFLQNNSPVYNLYLSSSATPDKPPVTTKGVTMEYALEYDDWDIIIMQSTPFEIFESEDADNHIQIIKDYVHLHKTNPNAVLAWHMPWTTPVDNDLRDMYPYSPNTYYTKYAEYNDDRSLVYKNYTAATAEKIVTDPEFVYLIASGTAIENALSSYLVEKDVYRDYAHVSDFGRVIASYTWYCTLAGIDHLDEIKLDAIPKAFLKSTADKTQDRVLTDMEKAIILESVNNALANPLQMTQSQYTEAPTE